MNDKQKAKIFDQMMLELFENWCIRNNCPSIEALHNKQAMQKFAQDLILENDLICTGNMSVKQIKAVIAEEMIREHIYNAKALAKNAD